MTDTNRTLAALFQAMAAELAAQQANPYRVRAYRRAAASLADLTEDVRAVADRGALRTIPGIGKDLTEKIEEFLGTGAIRAYEDLRRPLPPEVAAWRTLPGLSDGVVQYLYGRLAIRTLADLEALVRSHLLRTLPGVAATEEELLAAIRERLEGGSP